MRSSLWATRTKTFWCFGSCAWIFTRPACSVSSAPSSIATHSIPN
jgi:hypothetical protein